MNSGQFYNHHNVSLMLHFPTFLEDTFFTLVKSHSTHHTKRWGCQRGFFGGICIFFPDHICRCYDYSDNAFINIFVPLTLGALRPACDGSCGTEWNITMFKFQLTQTLLTEVSWSLGLICWEQRWYTRSNNRFLKNLQSNVLCSPCFLLTTTHTRDFIWVTLITRAQFRFCTFSIQIFTHWLNGNR